MCVYHLVEARVYPDSERKIEGGNRCYFTLFAEIEPWRSEKKKIPPLRYHAVFYAGFVATWRFSLKSRPVASEPCKSVNLSSIEPRGLLYRSCCKFLLFEKKMAFEPYKSAISPSPEPRDLLHGFCCKLAPFTEIWTISPRTCPYRGPCSRQIEFPPLRNHAVYYTVFAAN